MSKWLYLENYNPLYYFEQVDVLICRKLVDGVIKYACINIHGDLISTIEEKAHKLEAMVYGS
jgi:hypothetical protein